MKPDKGSKLSEMSIAERAIADGLDLRLVIFGLRVKTLRERRGLSIRDASAEIGIDKNTLMKMERGEDVRQSIREKVFNFYGMTPINPLARPLAVEYGKHYALHTPATSLWYMVKPNIEGQTAETSPAIQDPKERLRLGRSGLVSRFYRSFQLRMPEGVLSAGLVELYHRTEIHQWPAEVMIYALRGSVRVQVGDESFVISEGSAGVWDNSIANYYEPATPIGVNGFPAEFLLIDAV